MSKVMMHKKTGKLVEMTDSWFGKVIWLVDFDYLNPYEIAAFPSVIYDDDKRFKNYIEIGDC